MFLSASEREQLDSFFFPGFFLSEKEKSLATAGILNTKCWGAKIASAILGRSKPKRFAIAGI